MDEQKGRKVYKTAARTRITDFLKKNADRSVTAHDIMSHLNEQQLDVNSSTVYRYLGKLCEEGVVNRFSADNGEMMLYQYAEPMRNCDSHLHMQCVSCGRMIHLDCEFMDEIAGHILKDHGFEIVCKGSILYGTCSDCRTM